MTRTSTSASRKHTIKKATYIKNKKKWNVKIWSGANFAIGNASLQPDAEESDLFAECRKEEYSVIPKLSPDSEAFSCALQRKSQIIDSSRAGEFAKTEVARVVERPALNVYFKDRKPG